jgi:hypothetical protein
MSDSRSALIEKLKAALEAGEMMDVFGLAQDLLAETRRLGNPATTLRPRRCRWPETCSWSGDSLQTRSRCWSKRMPN